MLTTQGHVKESRSTMPDGSITRQKTLIDFLMHDPTSGINRKSFGLLPGEINELAQRHKPIQSHCPLHRHEARWQAHRTMRHLRPPCSGQAARHQHSLVDCPTCILERRAVRVRTPHRDKKWTVTANCWRGRLNRLDLWRRLKLERRWNDYMFCCWDC